MISTSFGWTSPYACPGMTAGMMPEPRVTLQALGLLSTLQEMGPIADVLHSMVVDLATSPETRDISGMWTFRQTLDHLAVGRAAAMGSLRRILCGDPGALFGLGIAGHLLIQALHLAGPQLERLIMEADLSHRPTLEHLGAGLKALQPAITHVTRHIEVAVGPELWNTAKAQAGVITGYGAD